MTETKPLFTSYSFGDPVSKKRLLITAGVHGDEFEPMLAVKQLIKYLDALPEDQLQARITLVPIVNHSAFKLASRCGEDNLDLARVCPGDPEGSLTEKLAHQLSQLIRQSTHYIDLHGGGKVYHIHPLAGYMLHPSLQILEQQRRMAKAFGYPLVWGTSAALEGRSLSVARDANVPAIYVENGGGEYRESLVESYVQGCLRVMVQLECISGEKVKKSEVESFLEIEEEFKNSGHLQAMMPAPTPGFFLAGVKVGERVKQGQLWGKIIHSDFEEETEVISDKEGLAFLLRAIPSVSQGDSLGGVLPLNASNHLIV